MGTRADYYIGKGIASKWLGSSAMDGYPSDKRIQAIMRAKTFAQYKTAVVKRLQEDDATLPEQGWPWPWEDSSGTDYAYTFNTEPWILINSIWMRCKDYFLPQDLPNMKALQKITLGKRSGLLVVGVARSGQTTILEED